MMKIDFKWATPEQRSQIAHAVASRIRIQFESEADGKIRAEFIKNQSDNQ